MSDKPLFFRLAFLAGAAVDEPFPFGAEGLWADAAVDEPFPFGAESLWADAAVVGLGREDWADAAILGLHRESLLLWADPAVVSDDAQ